MKNQVLGDIEQLFAQLVDVTGQAFWNLPLFESTPAAIRASPENHWYRMNYSLKEILDVGTADYETLVDLEILPQIAAQSSEGTPLQRSRSELQADEIPLLDEWNSNDDPLSSDAQVTPTDSIQRDDPVDTESLSHSDNDDISLADSEQDDKLSLTESKEERLTDE